MTARKRLLMMIYLAATMLPIMAQTAMVTAYQRTFGIRDGLAANSISGMDQDSKGLMWIGTWNGLCCFDGYRFTTFPAASWGEDDALSTNRIAQLHVNSRDNIWLRTYDGGLYLYDTHQYRYFNIGLALERKFGERINTRNIYCLPTGYTWISDERGNMNLRINDDKATDVERMEVFGKKGYPIDGQYIRKVETDAQGHEWLTTDTKMLRYEGNGKFSGGRSHDKTVGQDMKEDTALVWRLQACGLERKDIEKYHIDHQGNLWYTSARGLTLVNFRQQLMQQTPLVEGQQTRSVCCRRDGTVWAGTQDGYIGIFDKTGRQQGWLAANGSVTTGKQRLADRIYAIFEDSKGRLWIGTKGQGLFLCKMEDGRGKSGVCQHFIPDDGDPYSISSPHVYGFDEDQEGNIWIATYGGGVNVVRGKMEDGRGKMEDIQFLHRGNELKSYPKEGFDRVRRVTHTPQGIMLASTTQGLLTFDAKGKTFYTTRHIQSDTTSLRTNDVMQTLVAADGNIYVITQGGGIQLLTSKELLHDDLKLSLPTALNQGAGNVLSMTEDPQGNMWIAREIGIDRYQPKTGTVEQFGPNNMAEQTELTEAQPAISSDGRLWVGILGGLLSFDTNQMQKSRFRPDIVFTNVQYQGEQESAPILYRQSLVIAPNQRNLTVSFAAIDYGDKYLMQYAYRLDGNKEWNYIRTPHIAFSQLPPGRHLLMVKSTNGDGVWMDNDTELVIDVTPTIWERGWVRLLLLLLIIGLSTWAVIVWLRHRQHTKEREQRLEHILRQYRELQEQVDNMQGEESAANQPTPQREYKLDEPEIINEDEVMMDQLMKFLEQRIDDDGLRIDDMAEAVNLSRTVFYEKIRQIVGVSPVDFLKQVRMQRARQLIAKSTMSISQVAYAVGFTDPKYFARCFKKETGMTPSEYREQEKSDA